MKRLLLVFLFCLFASPAWAFPDNAVLDTFAGCVNDTTPPNSNWTNAVLLGATSANLECRSTAMGGVGIAASGDAYYNVATFNANCEAYATILSVTSAANAAVFCRLANIGANTTDGYMVEWTDGTSEVKIYRVDDGVETVLGAAISQAIAASDKWGIKTVGNQICAWFWDASGAATWVELGCRTDSTYTAGGRIGVKIFNTTDNVGIVDDFGGGNVSAARGQPIFLQ